MQKFIKADSAPEPVDIAELSTLDYKHVHVLADMPDWCLKAGEDYKLHFNGQTGYLKTSLGFLSPDQADLNQLSQSELNNLQLV